MKRTQAGLLAALAIGLAVAAQSNPEAGKQLEAAIHKEVADGDLKGAIEQFRKVASRYRTDRKIAASALLHIGQCQEKLGQAEARKAYESVIKEFADQTEIASQARSRLAGLAAGRSGSGSMAVRRVMVDTGRHTLWSISSDGRYASFNDGDTGNVGLRDLDAGEHRIVTQYGAWDNSKGYTDANAISRDGKQIAFWRYMWHARNGELRIIGADGKGDRAVYRAREGEWGIPTDWSPDGKYVMVQLERGKDGSMSEGDTDFAVISVADGSVRALKSVHYLRRYRPRILFSPDGKYVAYDYPTQPGGSNGDVYVVPVNGGPETAVASHAAHDYLLGWAPDGKSILLASNRSGAYGIWKVGVSDGRQTTEPELIRANTGNVWPIGVTKSGAIYYTARQDRSNILAADIDAESARTGQPAPPFEMVADVTSYPAWAPDGDRIAYSVRAPGVPLILAIRALGNSEGSRLIPKQNVYGQPIWSPDGSAVHMTGTSKNGRKGLYRVAVDTAEARLITETPHDFGWSPDGKYVFIAARSEKIHRIIRREVASGQEIELYHGGRIPRGISVSPDGRRFAFALSAEKAGEKASLCLLADEGGAIKELYTPAEGGVPFQSHEITWTPDGEKVLFVAGTSKNMNLWIVPAAGGVARKTNLKLPGYIGHLSMHPSGKRIAFTNSVSTIELWAMENFLH